MVIRIQPAVADAGAARALADLIGRVPDTEPLPPAADSAALLDGLARRAEQSVDALPEIVLVHELIGPMPALDLVREIALRFPAVAVVLLTHDTGPSLYSAAMDAGARGVTGVPVGLEELTARIGPAADWAAGVRRHLGGGAAGPGPAGVQIAVAGAKGGVGTTLTAVQLALAACASGRRTALVDLDLQSGDIASFLDVRYRRSAADLAGIREITPRVLKEAVYTHETGLGLLLAPGDGERGEEVDDAAARKILTALRARYETVVVDCGTQMNAGNAAAVETAGQAVLVTTPDVVAVRAATRMVRLWERLQVRRAADVLTVVNRASRHTEIQPPLVSRIVGTPVAQSTVPAHFQELHSALDAGRIQDLDRRSTVRRALWGLAAELGVTGGESGTAEAPDRGGPGALTARRGRGNDGSAVLPPLPDTARQALPPGALPQPARRSTGAFTRRRRPAPADGDDPERGALTVEFAGVIPLVLAVLVLLWQCVLIGHTFSLAGNAADEAAHAATTAAADGGDPAAACTTAARKELPPAWRSGAGIECHTGDGLWKAAVDLRTPLLLPGSATLPFTVAGRAGAAEEG